MYAYEQSIVPIVQELMGGMLDFAVYGLGYELQEFYDKYLNSKICGRIERADSSAVMGHSGIELCYDITCREHIENKKMDEYTFHAVNVRSKEYWTGWAVSYYQWRTALSYKAIEEVRNINGISAMYNICHEMDINQFVDRMNAVYAEKNPISKLKQIRQNTGLSQNDLAKITMIPLKTIQQYEQRQKNINNARVDYVIRLSRALNCEPEVLMEVNVEQ